MHKSSHDASSSSSSRAEARTSSSHESRSSSLFASMIAGGVAGCASKTAMAPLSRLTILYQVDSALHSPSKRIRVPLQLLNTSQLTRRLIRDEGIISLWKGNFTSLLHRFPYSAINFSVYELSKEALVSARELKEETAAIRFVAGAIGAAAACIICYPLDLIRTRLTLHNASVFGATSSSSTKKPSPLPQVNFSLQQSAILETYRGIIHAEGVRGLYRGLGVSLAVAIPTLSIGFAVYGSAKEYLLRHQISILTDKSSKNRLNAIGSLLCGASSGLCSSVLVYPADVIRRRMQVRGLQFTESLQSHATNQRQQFNLHAIDEVIQLYSKEGIKGFYRGITPELLKVIPAVGITFCVYDMMLKLQKPS
jgi:solute carrier family 25 (mitochondrial phosphate transporter), member 23/24/25/41